MDLSPSAWQCFALCIELQRTKRIRLKNSVAALESVWNPQSERGQCEYNSVAAVVTSPALCAAVSKPAAGVEKLPSATSEIRTSPSTFSASLFPFPVVKNCKTFSLIFVIPVLSLCLDEEQDCWLASGKMRKWDSLVEESYDPPPLPLQVFWRLHVSYDTRQLTNVETTTLTSLESSYIMSLLCLEEYLSDAGDQDCKICFKDYKLEQVTYELRCGRWEKWLLTRQGKCASGNIKVLGNLLKIVFFIVYQFEIWWHE